MSAQYRLALPQLDDDLFVTDGGLETTLIYRNGLELPFFAAFHLLRTASGRTALRQYFERYARMAQDYEAGLVLESATWRANPDWATRLGYDAAALADAQRSSIAMLSDIRDAFETPSTPIVISGNIGPRGDGYVVDDRMSARAAFDYHSSQIQTFATTEADMIAAFTMNYVEEAIGIVKAAREHAMPAVISFTVETDGHLPSGDTLERAIAITDGETDGYAAYYMINCAHPTHFARVLAESAACRARIRGVRANASTRSHAELDASTDLDDGNPQELALQYKDLTSLLPGLTVVGGCCGTDDRHVDRICSVLTSQRAEAHA
jgi:S-methylmethionine-dependent homocysteine/selenocysteine methylase